MREAACRPEEADVHLNDFESDEEDSKASPLDIDRFRGEIVTLGAVGRGSSGVVFKGFDVRRCRFVALKSSPEQLLLREALVLKKLRGCQHVPEAWGVSEPRKAEYVLVCEFATFGSLNHWLGVLSDAHLARVAGDVAAALAATHDAGLVHRDVKPSNVLLTREGPKLADFALAGVDQTCVGTFQYMSPERLESQAYGFAADVWGLGMSVLTAKLGRYPATHASIDDVWIALEVYEADDRLRRLAGADEVDPPDLHHLLDACLHFSPARRPKPRDILLMPYVAQRACHDISVWTAPFRDVEGAPAQLDALLDKFQDHYGARSRVPPFNPDQIRALALELHLPARQVCALIRARKLRVHKSARFEPPNAANRCFSWWLPARRETPRPGL